ncbi:MAG: hypothetical protein ACTHK7_20970 [Aureliella sp.]
MLFAISVPDLLAILVCAAVALAMYFKRDRHLRWGLAALGCMTVAALITPPDLFSTLLTASAMMAVYFVGTRHHRRPAHASA